MNKHIKGNFTEALEILISRLARAKGSNKLAYELLYEWDQRRGNDWFTDTKKAQESRELKRLADLKSAYEEVEVDE